MRKLALEAVGVLLVVAIAIVVVWKTTVRHTHNPRALGGANVDVTPVIGTQTEAAFVVVPGHPEQLFGVDNDLTVHASTDGGRTWRTSDPAALTRLCTHRDPAVAAAATGRQYIAYVASDLCGDELVPHLLVASRASATAPWRVARVAKAAWGYGFDDAPAIAVAGTHAYVAWTRSLGKAAQAVSFSRSDDGGATWSAPVVLDPPAARSHLARVAVGPNGDVFVSGLDVPHGIWAVRSTDGGRTFSKPVRLARLLANPSPDCARTGEVPVANEARTCAGPNESLVVTRDRVYAVYADFAPDKTQDVVVGAATPALRPLFHATVNPPQPAKTQQIIPVAAADPATGVLAACWYDSAYWPGGKRVWFTCAHSRNGRAWSTPVRAAAVPTPLDFLYGVYGSSGLEPSLTIANGIAHPFWLDGRRADDDVFTARVPLPG